MSIYHRFDFHHVWDFGPKNLVKIGIDGMQVRLDLKISCRSNLSISQLHFLNMNRVSSFDLDFSFQDEVVPIAFLPLLDQCLTRIQFQQLQVPEDIEVNISLIVFFEIYKEPESLEILI